MANQSGHVEGLEQILDLAAKGIAEINDAQRAVLAASPEPRVPGRVDG